MKRQNEPAHPTGDRIDFDPAMQNWEDILCLHVLVF